RPDAPNPLSLPAALPLSAKGWTSPLIETTAVTGIVLLTVLAVVELRMSAPMLDLRLLGNGLFRNATMLNSPFPSSRRSSIGADIDRKSTRLNSSHSQISY